MTLDKSEGGFSPTTSYRDYAISREQFHWETQNSAAEDTPTGRRYVEQDRNGWRFFLFVRETRGDAFVALGPVRYVSHTGERPAPGPQRTFPDRARAYLRTAWRQP